MWEVQERDGKPVGVGPKNGDERLLERLCIDASKKEKKSHKRTQGALLSLAFSDFNPPPANRMIQGDLLYLRAVMCDSTVVHITAHSGGFYVNRSTDERFDPTEHSSRPCHAHDLRVALQLRSADFKTKFAELQKADATKTVHELHEAPYPVERWIDCHKVHRPSQSRAQAVQSRWSEVDPLNPGLLRDWNDELQTLRDLPSDTPAARTLRDRALFKFDADFVASAQRGAQAVVFGNVPPMNPLDPEMAHMFVWSNIFFSYASDSRGVYADQGGDAAAQAAANNDLRGVRLFQNVQNPSLCTLATVLVNFMGRRLVAQSIVPGILRQDQSKAMSYGIDEINDSMIIEPEFSALLARTTEKLHLKPHTVLYKDDTTKHMLHSSIDCKGVKGSDGRFYALELMRSTPVDCGARHGPDTLVYSLDGTSKPCPDWTPPHRFNLLRFELVEAYCQSKKGANGDGGDDAIDGDTEEVDDELLFNPDVFTSVQHGDSAESVAKDESNVLALSEYLQTVVIPRFVDQLCGGSNTNRGVLSDGVTLCQMMHDAGINLRYLGMVASLVEANQSTPSTKRHIQALCVLEMVSRAAKHRLRQLMISTRTQHMAVAIAHFLNCLVNSRTTTLGRRGITGGKKTRTTGTSVDNGFSSSQTSTLLWSELVQDMYHRFRFQFTRDELDMLGIHVSAVLRAVCMKSGVKIVAKEYDWSAARGATFAPRDILGVYPLTKRIPPNPGVGQLEYYKAVANIGCGEVGTSLEGFDSAALSFHQVTGVVHEGIARCNQMIALIMRNIPGQQQRAVQYQERAVGVLERVLGLDAAETIHAYAQLGQFLHYAGTGARGICFLEHAHDLYSAVLGGPHPEHGGLELLMAACHTENNNPAMAKGCIMRAKESNTRFFGANSVQVARAWELESKIFRRTGNLRGAVTSAKQTHRIFSIALGENNQLTCEAFGTLNRVTAECVKALREQRSLEEQKLQVQKLQVQKQQVEQKQQRKQRQKKQQNQSKSNTKARKKAVSDTGSPSTIQVVE